METDFWGNTLCTAARFDEKAGEWVVTVVRGGETLTLRPQQLVLATGLSGSKYIPVIPAQSASPDSNIIRPITAAAKVSQANAAWSSVRTIPRTTSASTSGNTMPG